MNRFFRFQLQFIRHKTFKTTNVAKRSKSKNIALPQKAEEKIRLWQKSLTCEIKEFLSTNKTISNLTFKSFTGDPINGLLIEFYLPSNVLNELDNLQMFFKPGTWIDLKINDSKIGGYFLEFNDDTLRLRIRDAPPASVYEQPQMSISIADDRFVMDFLLDFWKDEKWRTLPGMKNFLKAYLVLPMTFGKVRGKVNFINQNLNDSQRHAVDLAMQPLQSLLSIQGPPGTGKTDVVAEIILQYYRKDKSVLVLASSNKAVDNVAERVYRQMNNSEDQYRLTSNTNSSPFSLKDAINSHKNYELLENACNRVTDFWDQEKFKQKYAHDPKNLHNNICKDLFSNANVIYSTFTSSSVRKLKERKFSPDLVIIDEAGQASECLAWFGMLQAPKAIVVGDQQQLGPIVRTNEAIAANYGQSVMSYLFDEFGSKIQTRLKTQYRSNEKIMRWSNDTFYEGEITADKSVQDISVKDIIDSKSKCYTDPLILIDTLNCNYHERRVQTSYANPKEAEIVANQVRLLINGGLEDKKIGVITPYRSQVDLIKSLISDIPNVLVSSVDGFQGSECEVICMSLVRSRPKNIELGFLIDLRRMNVSITRAKRQFFLVANSNTMKEDKDLNNLLNTIIEHGTVIKFSETNLQKQKIIRKNRIG